MRDRWSGSGSSQRSSVGCTAKVTMPLCPDALSAAQRNRLEREHTPTIDENARPQFWGDVPLLTDTVCTPIFMSGEITSFPCTRRNPNIFVAGGIMFTRTRALAVALVVAASVIVGLAVDHLTGRPESLFIALGLGAMVASIVLVVSSGSHAHSRQR
jgi:hypothetical protein